MNQLKKIALPLVALTFATLTSCVEESENITQSVGYGTVVYDATLGENILEMDDASTGTRLSKLKSPTDALDEYAEGERMLFGYTINWDEQPANSDYYDAEIRVASTWQTEEFAYIATEGEPFVTDTLQTFMPPFITYDSNGRSIITLAAEMFATEEGGTTGDFYLVDQTDYVISGSPNAQSDTLYLIYEKGDVDLSQKVNGVYKSYYLPDYGDDEVDIVVRVESSWFTSNAGFAYIEPDKYRGGYFKIRYNKPLDTTTTY